MGQTFYFADSCPRKSFNWPHCGRRDMHASFAYSVGSVRLALCRHGQTGRAVPVHCAQTHSRQWPAVADEDCMPWTTVEVARQISLHALGRFCTHTHTLTEFALPAVQRQRRRSGGCFVDCHRNGQPAWPLPSPSWSIDGRRTPVAAAWRHRLPHCCPGHSCPQ